MSKLLAALVAIGFGIGINGAFAQNVDSDKAKAQDQERIMQEKETGAAHSDGAGQGGTAMDQDQTSQKKSTPERTKKIPTGKPGQSNAPQSQTGDDSGDQTAVHGKPDQNQAEQAGAKAKEGASGNSDTSNRPGSER